MELKLSLVLGLIAVMVLPIAMLSATWNGDQGMVLEELELAIDSGTNYFISDQDKNGARFSSSEGDQGMIPEDPFDIGVDDTISNDDEVGYTVLNDEQGKIVEGPETALEKAVNYVISREELQGLVTPDSWKRENITPERLLGATTLRFTEGEWTVKILFASVDPSVYDVEIDYASKDGPNWDGRINGRVENGFHWEGKIDVDGNVTETVFATT